MTWINATEELKYDPIWFAYNHLEVVALFVGPVHWSQNDAWYLELRERMARSIEQLRSKGVAP